ncbi:MAG TPA: ABC transporter permease [Longimicrobiales bacterium]
MESILKDLRYAVRTLRRSPGFTLAALVTLALGIGANTAVFSVVNGVVLRPLPYPEPERVVYIGWDYGSGASKSETAYKFEYIREHGRVFEGVSTERAWATALGEAAVPDEVTGLRVSEDFFRVVGVQPVLGRAFLPEEDVPGGRRVVVLGDELWRTRFDADPGVLGRPVRLGGEPYTVVGVMPPGFHVPEQPGAADFFVPFQLDPDPRDGGMNYVIRARIRPGVTPEQVRADLLAVSRQFKAEHPELVRENETGPGARLWEYGDIYVGGLERTLWVLLGAVGFVLLIACVNVANLLLARSTGRRREMAIRAAIGAGRGRIARQLLAESLLLALGSAIVGLLVGRWSVDALLAFAPAGLPRMDEIGLDGRVLSFTLAVGGVTGVAFGLTAAWHAFRTDLNGSLRDGGARQGSSRAGLRVRSAFVTAQAALAVVLLTGAGLLIASFFRLQSVDTGFDPDGVVAVAFRRTPAEYAAPGRIWTFERQLLERVRSIPGVEAAAATSALPFRGQFNFPMTVVGRPEATRPDVQWRSVSPDYFGTLRTPLLRGREFDARDAAQAPPVAIVNETFARKYFGDEDPIGQRIDIGTIGGREVIPGFDDPARTIVGVVADTRVLSLDGEVEEIMYTPRAQEPVVQGYFGLGGLLVRTRGAAAVAPAVLAAVRELDPRMPVPQLVPMREAIGASIAQERFNTVLLGAFAGLALVLTAIGIYGVVAYSVRQRTAEIGIRVALGADRRTVLGMVVRQGMTPVAIGLGLGLLSAVALTRLISSLLFGVSPTDPATIGAVAGVIAAVAFAATWLPARRAAGVDPVVALKTE